ncbi:MAG: YgaP family membrane protein [Candidatus Zhuqueibacterota bacterium]
MKRNVGGADKTVRILIGVVILGLGLASKCWLGLIGLVPLLTGLTGRCLLYYPLGVSTCTSERRKKDVE